MTHRVVLPGENADPSHFCKCQKPDRLGRKNVSSTGYVRQCPRCGMKYYENMTRAEQNQEEIDNANI